MAQDGLDASEPGFAAQRRAMVDGQIRTFDVTDQRVIRAFSVVPREAFLTGELRPFAYSDAALTLDAPRPGREARVLLRPMHLARMIQGAALLSADRVLLVAGGSGYAACVLAEIAASVVALESEAAFSEATAAGSQRFGLDHIRAVTGDLFSGWPEGAPYDVIVVQGAVETNLDTLLGQLAPGGRLVAIECLPGGSRRVGRALRLQRSGGETSARALFDATAPILADFRAPPSFVF